MIVRAPRPLGNFYILNKAISEDRRLTWGARGLLVYLLGKPDHWRVSSQALVNETVQTVKPAGREAVANLLTELIESGYCIRVQPRLADGKLGPVEHQIHETPDWVPADAPQTGLPRAADPQSPQTGLPRAANPRQVRIEKKAKTENNNNTTGAREVKLSFDNQAGEFEGLSEVVLAKWQVCFPLVNVTLEIGRAGAWLLANPTHDKKNYQRFLHNWLSRSQDRAASEARPAGRPGVSGKPMSRAERGQAAGMALLGIPAEAYLPGAPLWTGQGEVIDISIDPPVNTGRRAS